MKRILSKEFSISVSSIFAQSRATRIILFAATLVTLVQAPALADEHFQSQAFADQERPVDAGCIGKSQSFMRTELFFGLARLDGVLITEDEFRTFVDEFVTPRFPDGLTILNGAGQYRDARGKIVLENSKILVVLVARSNTARANTKFEAIRKDYQLQFQQESVLRTDTAACVSF